MYEFEPAFQQNVERELYHHATKPNKLQVNSWCTVGQKVTNAIKTADWYSDQTALTDD